MDTGRDPAGADGARARPPWYRGCGDSSPSVDCGTEGKAEVGGVAGGFGASFLKVPRRVLIGAGAGAEVGSGLLDSLFEKEDMKDKTGEQVSACSWRVKDGLLHRPTPTAVPHPDRHSMLEINEREVYGVRGVYEPDVSGASSGPSRRHTSESLGGRMCNDGATTVIKERMAVLSDGQTVGKTGSSKSGTRKRIPL